MISPERKKPFVSFVGAGPGDPDLLTLRAFRKLNEAEIVLHDALGTEKILVCLSASVRRVNVGKRAGRHSMPQEEINRLLVGLARRGKRIVRLKGGDPVIFGRLDEETAALAAAGIGYEIVPGITAASAAAASAGISLTRRAEARRVQFVTGHTRDGEAFDPVASGITRDATSVIYMGRSAAAHIRARLLAAGWPGDTPVLLVAGASQSGEVRVTGRLDRLEEAVLSLPRELPLVMILGVAAVPVRESGVGEAGHAKEPRGSFPALMGHTRT